MPEAEIYAESRKEVNIYAESILPGIRKADEIPLLRKKGSPPRISSQRDSVASLRHLLSSRRVRSNTYSSMANGHLSFFVVHPYASKLATAAQQKSPALTR